MPVVRVIARGMDGQLLLEGAFEVLHRELGEDGTVDLVAGDRGRRLSIRIPIESLEEVSAPPGADEIRRRAREAENALIDRWQL